MAISGFQRSDVDTGEVKLSVHRAGSGKPLILLHGYPQNHACWTKVAPALSMTFDVIVPDLRGYGESDAPEDDEAHTVYSKRWMAMDVVALIDALGLEKAAVLGHDRGARVAYRMALDHPGRVARIGIVEIVPTGDFWAAWNADLALAAYHWTFLAQPAPLPERMIAADPVGYVDWTLSSWTASRTLEPFNDGALQSYRAQAKDPRRVAAMCADYRAGATTDRRQDEADRTAGARIVAPLMFVYARTGFPARTGDPAGLWRAWADDVTAMPADGGHFLPEENPQALLDAFGPFLCKD
jgi:haloacetate dehalogenase